MGQRSLQNWTRVGGVVVAAVDDGGVEIVPFDWPWMSLRYDCLVRLCCNPGDDVDAAVAMSSVAV